MGSSHKGASALEIWFCFSLPPMSLSPQESLKPFDTVPKEMAYVLLIYAFDFFSNAMIIFQGYNVNNASVCILYAFWYVFYSALSYSHMGGIRLGTNFAIESKVVPWRCGDRNGSKETYSEAYNLTGVWRITFQPQRPLRQFLTAGLRQHFCLIRRTHRTTVHSMWPLLLKQ